MSNAAINVTNGEGTPLMAGGTPPREPPRGGSIGAESLDFFDEAAVDEALDRARAKFGAGNVVAVLTVSGWAIFRAPTAAEAMRYKSLLSDEKNAPTAAGIMARVLVIWPSRETFGEWADAKPLIADEVRGPWLELAGLTGKAVTKK